MVDIEELVRQAKEVAWREGHDRGYEDGWDDLRAIECATNPYTKRSN